MNPRYPLLEIRSGENSPRFYEIFYFSGKGYLTSNCVNKKALAWQTGAWILITYSLFWLTSNNTSINTAIIFTFSVFIFQIHNIESRPTGRFTLKGDEYYY